MENVSVEKSLAILKVKLKRVNLEQEKKREKDGFSPQYIAHGTYVAPEEFAKIAGNNTMLPAFVKETQNELNEIRDFCIQRPEFCNQLKEKGIKLDRELEIPKRVFGLPTKTDNIGSALFDKEGMPVPQAGSYAYALKKCSASIGFLDNGDPLLIGFEQTYKKFEEGSLKGHIYILESKGFEANYNKDGVATEWTFQQNARIVHHLDVTPEKAMQGGAQFVVFQTEQEYIQWSQNNNGPLKSEGTMRSLAEQITLGNATYINATSRGVLPRISVLEKAQKESNHSTDMVDQVYKLQISSKEKC